jgi:hypothetical protein
MLCFIYRREGFGVRPVAAAVRPCPRDEDLSPAYSDCRCCPHRLRAAWVLLAPPRRRQRLAAHRKVKCTVHPWQDHVEVAAFGQRLAGVLQPELPQRAVKRPILRALCPDLFEAWRVALTVPVRPSRANDATGQPQSTQGCEGQRTPAVRHMLTCSGRTHAPTSAMPSSTSQATTMGFLGSPTQTVLHVLVPVYTQGRPGTIDSRVTIIYHRNS